jgi:hypothetical protein
MPFTKKNWKAPGLDGIANIWIKNLPIIREDLALAYNDIVKHPEKCPEWLTRGTTYLLPKSEETRNPKNYRPITCLPTMYKRKLWLQRPATDQQNHTGRSQI